MSTKAEIALIAVAYVGFIALIVIPACRWVKRCDDAAHKAAWEKRHGRIGQGER
jgi:hypothetical protein